MINLKIDDQSLVLLSQKKMQKILGYVPKNMIIKLFIKDGVKARIEFNSYDRTKLIEKIFDDHVEKAERKL